MLLQSAPYGDERVYNGLRLSQALISATIKMKVNIFLIGDGVSTDKRGQKPPEEYYNLGLMLKNLIKKGALVVACRTCVSARGLSQSELIEGARVGSTVGDLAKWVKKSQKVVSF